MIIAGGLAIRTAVLLWYLSTHGWKAETWEYEVIANSLLAGKGLAYPYHGTVYLSALPPVFPAICAALHWLGGPGFGLFYVFHLACAAVVIGLTYRLALRLFCKESAAFAALFASLEPGLIIYQSYKVDVVTLSSLLLLLAFGFFLRAMRTERLRYSAAAGLAAGLGMLVRPDVVSFLGAPFMWVVRERLSISVSRRALVIAGATALVMTPWFIRNYVIHQRFIPTMTVTGQLLWYGNNPNSTATPWTTDGRPQYNAAPEELKRRIEGAGELANLDLFRGAAMTYIAEHPALSVQRCLKRLVYFWWFAPEYAKSPQYTWAPGLLVAGYKVLYLGILILAVIGAVAASREGVVEAAFLWAPPVALDLIHCFHYVEGRHRLLILPLLLILSGRGLAEILSRWRAVD